MTSRATATIPVAATKGAAKMKGDALPKDDRDNEICREFLQGSPVNEIAKRHDLTKEMIKIVLCWYGVRHGKRQFGSRRDRLKPEIAALLVDN